MKKVLLSLLKIVTILSHIGTINVSALEVVDKAVDSTSAFVQVEELPAYLKVPVTLLYKELI